MLDDLDGFLSGVGVLGPPPQEKPEDELDKYLKSVGVMGQPEKPADDLDSFLSTQGLSPQGDIETEKKPGFLKQLGQQFVEKIGGLGEAGLSTVSGLAGGMAGAGVGAVKAVSEIGPWAMGKLQGLTGGPQPFTGAEKVMGQTQELLTYKPKTEFGGFVTDVANAPFNLVGQGADIAARKIFLNEPEGQAAVRLTTSLILNGLMFKYGARIAKGEPLRGVLSEATKSDATAWKELNRAIPNLNKENVAKMGGPKKVLDDIVNSVEQKPEVLPVPEKISAPPIPDTAGVIPKEQMPPVTPPKIGPESGTLAYGQELPKKIGNTNLERIIDAGLTPETAGVDAYGTKKVLEEALRDTQAQRTARGVKVTKEWVEANKGAEVLGKEFSAEDIAKRFGLKTRDLDEITMAARNTVVTMADRVRGLIKITATNPSEENMAHLAVARSVLEKTFIELSSGSADIGRALNIHRQLSQSMEFIRAKQYHLVLKTLTGNESKEVTKAILDRAVKMEFATPEEFARFMRDSYKATTKEKVMEAWINSILTNPTTQIANVVGNFSTLLTEPLETGLTVAYQLRKGKERGVFFSEVGKQYKGMLAGLSEGWKKAVYAFKNETTSSVGKTEMRYNRAAIKGLKGKIVRVPGRMLGAADEFFKTLVYTADIYSGAQRVALKSGLRGDSLYQKWAELVNNPTEPMKAYARQDALYRTFQNDLGSLGNKLMSMRNHNIAFRFIVPFMRTPANILKYAYERTPVGFFKAAKRGLTSVQRSELLARATMGTVFMGMAAEMAQQGLITGTGQFMDKNERDRKYAGGWRPNSFKVFGKYISYARIDPASTIVGIAADLNDLAHRFPSMIKNKDAESAAINALMSFIGNSVNKTYLRGAFDLFNAITEPPSSTAKKNKVLRTLATSPIPSVSGAIARATDPYIREVNSMLDAVKNKIPGLSKTLPAAIDITGKPVKREGGPIWQMIVPATISTEKDNPVLNELNRLNVSMGMPSKTTKAGKMEPGKYARMTSQEWDYISRQISSTISQPFYRKISDEVKTRILKSIISRQRSWIRKLYAGVEE